MRLTVVIALAVGLLAAAGCEKKEDAPVTPSPTGGSGIFTSSNVKTAPVYFSFDAKDSVPVSGAWDLKLTTMYAPDDTAKAFKYPGIALNRQRNVQAKIVDGQTYESVDQSAATALQTDPNDTTVIIGIRCLYYTGPPSHRLNPYDNRTFVVQTGSGKRAKLRMLSYYNDQGVSGYMKFEYFVK